MRSPLQRAYGDAATVRQKGAGEAALRQEGESAPAPDIDDTGYPHPPESRTTVPVAVPKQQPEGLRITSAPDLDGEVGELLSRREAHEERGRAFNVWKFRPTRTIDNTVRPAS